ncbi:unnamed protein product [Ascophyllum nodosum]
MKWPGVQWEGWLDCPNHPKARIYLTPPGEARINGELLYQGAYAHSMVCDCSREPDGVLKLVRQDLGTVVDTRSFVPEVRGQKTSLQRYLNAVAKLSIFGGQVPARRREPSGH